MNDILMTGCSARDLKKAGYCEKDLHLAGFFTSELKKANNSDKDILMAGYSASDLKEAGYSAGTSKWRTARRATRRRSGSPAAPLAILGMLLIPLRTSRSPTTLLAASTRCGICSTSQTCHWHLRW
eukprot:gnl/TRDRNA2_/TRDRNA2_76451_c1_seq2.p1 gnl/TRDRNA2_/TRDRNA2_76451_c1~~gnl/TRDRNA2_/TRDRNA2_76451_c1_seq2.p1  ORF type:complete len:126 (+),score=12.63 gnl/TRDRNA2_/TRDRNA2_76451_c1_seq2:171-548(+)